MVVVVVGCDSDRGPVSIGVIRSEDRMSRLSGRWEGSCTGERYVVMKFMVVTVGLVLEVVVPDGRGGRVWGVAEIGPALVGCGGFRSRSWSWWLSRQWSWMMVEVKVVAVVCGTWSWPGSRGPSWRFMSD